MLTTRGSFIIPIRAVLPTVSMQVPANLEFGYCPAKEAAKRTFQMVNTGELEVSFAWKIRCARLGRPPGGGGDSAPLLAGWRARLQALAPA